MLAQLVEHRDVLDHLRFIVLLANLNEFLFRGRQKPNYTKVNEVLMDYVKGEKKRCNGKQLHAFFFFFNLSQGDELSPSLCSAFKI